MFSEKKSMLQPADTEFQLRGNVYESWNSFQLLKHAKKMLSYITGNGFYDNSYVGKWIFQVMGEEMGEREQSLMSCFTSICRNSHMGTTVP